MLFTVYLFVIVQNKILKENTILNFAEYLIQNKENLSTVSFRNTKINIK